MKNYYDAPDFFKEDGIKIQTGQLECWKKVLKPEVFERLKAFAVQNNDQAEDGWDIIRGQQLDSFVFGLSQE
jgi:hypothetical protein